MSRSILSRNKFNIYLSRRTQQPLWTETKSQEQKSKLNVEEVSVAALRKTSEGLFMQYTGA